MLLHNWTLLGLAAGLVAVYLLLVWVASKRALDSPWRRLLSAVWNEPSGPELFGLIRFRTGPALAFMQEFNVNKGEGEKLTITHMMTKAWAKGCAGGLNVKIAGGFLSPYPSTDVACLVALDGGKDLGWVTIERCDEKSLTEIEIECSKRFKSAREGEERKSHQKATAIFALIPSCLGAILMELGSWVSVQLGMDLAILSVKKHPFGCSVITNVGKKGVDAVYPPFSPVARVTSFIAISKPVNEAIVVDGHIQAEECLQGGISFDLRFLTRDQCVRAVKAFKTAMENPKEHLA
jgi:hypothetical protein